MDFKDPSQAIDAKMEELRKARQKKFEELERKKKMTESQSVEPAESQLPASGENQAASVPLEAEPRADREEDNLELTDKEVPLEPTDKVLDVAEQEEQVEQHLPNSGVEGQEEIYELEDEIGGRGKGASEKVSQAEPGVSEQNSLTTAREEINEAWEFRGNSEEAIDLTEEDGVWGMEGEELRPLEKELADARRAYVVKDFELDKVSSVFYKLFKIGKRGKLGEANREFEAARDAYLAKLAEYKDALMENLEKKREKKQHIEKMASCFMVEEFNQRENVLADIKMENYPAKAARGYLKLVEQYRALSWKKKLAYGMALGGAAFAAAATGGAVGAAAAGGAMALRKIFVASVSATGSIKMADAVAQRHHKKKAGKKVEELQKGALDAWERVDFTKLNQFFTDQIKGVDNEIQKRKRWSTWRKWGGAAAGVGMYLLGGYLGRKGAEHAADILSGKDAIMAKARNTIDSILGGKSTEAPSTGGKIEELSDKLGKAVDKLQPSNEKAIGADLKDMPPHGPEADVDTDAAADKQIESSTENKGVIKRQAETKEPEAPSGEKVKGAVLEASPEKVEVTVKRGDSVWKILERQLNQRGYFEKLHGTAEEIQAKKTYLIDALKDKMTENPRAYGISSGDADLIHTGDKLDLSAILGNAEGMKEVVGDADKLGSRAVQSILDNLGEGQEAVNTPAPGANIRSGGVSYGAAEPERGGNSIRSVANQPAGGEFQQGTLANKQIGGRAVTDGEVFRRGMFKETFLPDGAIVESVRDVRTYLSGGEIDYWAHLQTESMQKLYNEAIIGSERMPDEFEDKIKNLFAAAQKVLGKENAQIKTGDTVAKWTARVGAYFAQRGISVEDALRM